MRSLSCSSWPTWISPPEVLQHQRRGEEQEVDADAREDPPLDRRHRRMGLEDLVRPAFALTLQVEHALGDHAFQSVAAGVAAGQRRERLREHVDAGPTGPPQAVEAHPEIAVGRAVVGSGVGECAVELDGGDAADRTALRCRHLRPPEVEGGIASRTRRPGETSATGRQASGNPSAPCSASAPAPVMHAPGCCA